MKRIASLCHDMTNKLTIAAGNIRMLRKLPGLSPDQERRMDAVDLAVVHAISLCKEAQTVANDEIAERLEEWVISERVKVAKDIAEKLRALYSLELIVADAPEEAASYYVNPSCSERIFQNLVDNASKAGATKIKVEWVVHEFSVDAKVTDNGSGMSQEVLKKLGFGYSTSGSGKGFASIREDIASMGGAVEVVSEVGMFTQVTIKFKRVLVSKKNNGSQDRAA